MKQLISNLLGTIVFTVFILGSVFGQNNLATPKESIKLVGWDRWEKIVEESTVEVKTYPNCTQVFWTLGVKSAYYRIDNNGIVTAEFFNDETLGGASGYAPSNTVEFLIDTIYGPTKVFKTFGYPKWAPSEYEIKAYLKSIKPKQATNGK